MHLFVSLFFLSGIALGDSTSNLMEKKKEFLKTPIFKNRRDSLENSAQWKNREQDIESKLGSTETLPLTTNKKTLNLSVPSLQSPSLSTPGSRAAGQTKIPPNSLPQYYNVPKPKMTVDASECGFNSYTLNYCLYQTPQSKPLLCAEKWNRCLEGYQP